MASPNVTGCAVLSLLDAPSAGSHARPATRVHDESAPRACARFVADFLDSAACDDLDVEPDHVVFVARQLVDFKVRYGDGDPLRWSPRIGISWGLSRDDVARRN